MATGLLQFDLLEEKLKEPTEEEIKGFELELKAKFSENSDGNRFEIGLNLNDIDVLSPKQEKRLFRALKANSHDPLVREEIASKIMDSNLPLVAFFAQKIGANCQTGILGCDDLFQAGWEGLEIATKRFDWKQGYKFSTYASYYITRYIMLEIEKYAFLVRLSTGTSLDVRLFQWAKNRLVANSGDNPSLEEIGEEIVKLPRKKRQKKTPPRKKFSLKKLARIQEALKTRRTFSFNEPISKNWEGTAQSLLDILPDTSSDVYGKVEVISRNKSIVYILKRYLTPRERKVLVMRFGLGGSRRHSLQSVGKEFGITRERVRQIEQEALKKLRNPEAEARLKDFIT